MHIDSQSREHRTSVRRSSRRERTNERENERTNDYSSFFAVNRAYRWREES